MRQTYIFDTDSVSVCVTRFETFIPTAQIAIQRKDERGRQQNPNTRNHKAHYK